MTFTNIENKLPSHDFIVCKEMDSIGLKTTRTKYLWNLLKIPQRNFSRLAAEQKKRYREIKREKQVRKITKKNSKSFIFLLERNGYLHKYVQEACVCIWKEHKIPLRMSKNSM